MTLHQECVDLLYSAHEFISRVTQWDGSDTDERDELLAEIDRLSTKIVSAEVES